MAATYLNDRTELISNCRHNHKGSCIEKKCTYTIIIVNDYNVIICFSCSLYSSSLYHVIHEFASKYGFAVSTRVTRKGSSTIYVTNATASSLIELNAIISKYK